jgi:alkylhydroperoxidase family enzyme
MRLIDRLLFYKVAPRQIRYLAPFNYSKATGLGLAVIDQLARDFVVGPPVTIHLPNPELMAGVWAMGRECLAAGREGREKRELIAAEVSRLNACPYCLDVHSAMLHAFDHGDAFTDPAFAPYADWASATLTPDSPLFRNPPFPAAEGPKFLGTAVCFHYLNRMVNVFLDPAPFTFHGRAIIRMSGKMLRPLVTAQRVEQGDFLTPAAPSLPPEFAWAFPDPYIAGGLARFAAAAEAAGAESVEPAVQELVIGQVANWRGEAPPLDWTSGQTPSARLALLTALASYQVDDKVIAAFRQQGKSDRDLINVTAWASYVAVKRIASWIES